MQLIVQNIVLCLHRHLSRRRLELRAEHLVPKHRALAEVTTRMHVVRVMVATANRNAKRAG